MTRPSRRSPPNAGDARFAWDSYRRFIQMYGDVVMGVDHDFFEEILDDAKANGGHEHDTELSPAEWQNVIVRLQGADRRRTRRAVSAGSAWRNLWGAIGAVFKSWMNPRAVTYRQLHAIPEDWGTAVNVQAMVFGNMGDTSATGVAFTRNPSTGDNALYGEFLVNAQGEDVVAGIRTPQIADRSGARCLRLRPAVARKTACRTRSPNSTPSPASLKPTTATCRTWNSPSSAASCGCCRRAPESAPPRRR